MLFNFGKYKCLHTGHGTLDVNCKMGDTVLSTTVKENYLGVTISADMNVSEQCGIATSKDYLAVAILGCMRCMQQHATVSFFMAAWGERGQIWQW